MSLAEFLNEMEAADEELTKEAAELEKQAAEEDAAGRIMARGFMDELNKLAQVTGKGTAADPMKGFKPMNVGKSWKPGSTVPPAKKNTHVNPGRLAGTRSGQAKMNRGGY